MRVARHDGSKKPFPESIIIVLSWGRKRGEKLFEAKAGAEVEAILKTFGLKRDALPLALFLWGMNPVCVSLQNAPSPEAFLRTLDDVRGRARKDWVSKGWKGTSARGGGRGAGGAMDVRDLEVLRALEDLHRGMAEGLLANLSAEAAKDLVRRGIVKANDFVVEDVVCHHGISLSLLIPLFHPPF